MSITENPRSMRLIDLWDSAWTTGRSYPSQTFTIPEPVNRIGRLILWPLAIMVVIHAVFVLAVNGSVTDDFTTVYQALRRFIEGVNVYNENYTYVDPHYLYSPGATLLLSPLALMGSLAKVRMLFVILNALSICIALGIGTRIIGYTLSSVVFPGAIVCAFLTESVRNTLVFSNINGVLLLALMLFIICTLNKRPWWAGIFLGLAIVVKPIFVPLLFIPFVYRYWKTIVVAIALPIVINIIAWPIIPGASNYVSRTMPYLNLVRDFSNSSLSGQATYFGISHGASLLLAGLMAIITIVGIIFLLRIRNADPVLWITATSSLLLAAVFFLSSLGQMYYSMLLFPLVLTVLRRLSPMHTWIMWFALYAIYSPQSWELDTIQGRQLAPGQVFGQMPNPVWGQWLLPLLPCIGWAMFIIIISTVAFYWWYEERAEVHLARHRDLRAQRLAPSDITA